MRKYILLLFSLIFISNAFTQGQNDWVKKAKFAGDKRERAISFAIGDYGYVGMGEDTAEMTHNDLWKYDPSLDTWTQMMSLPGSTRRNASAAAAGGKGYVGLGADSSVSWMGSILKDWWEYDPTANNWLQKANYPGGYDMNNNTSADGVYFAASFSLNNKVYICGGKMGPDFYGTDLWEYDPTLDQWTRKADFPGLDRYQHSAFAVDGKGYVGMGIDHDLYRKDWWQYNPSNDSWQQVADLPGPERGAASTFVLGQHGFVVLGSDGGYKDELWEYNPFSDSWQIRANFPGDGRKNAVAFAIGERGYAGTGKGQSGKRRSFYEYNPLYPVGLNESEFIAVNVYPNPAAEHITIDFDAFPNENRNIFVYSTNGKLIYHLVTQESKLKIAVDELKAGNYILIVKENQKEIYSNVINII